MYLNSLPPEILKDIETAREILLASGASEMYIFGSIAEGTYEERSDLDIAVAGLEKEKFFSVYGELLSRISRSIDLVGIDYQTDFTMELLKKGKLLKVA